MARCPNCGANARFDIASQKLVCDYCGIAVDPKDYIEKKETGDGTYETNVYRCPVCGGEIASTDESASEFCSYCGATVVLEKRLEKERRPAEIIPFQCTKDDCKKAYLAYISHSFFIPRSLKDPKHIDSFRGIYIPYNDVRMHYRGEAGVQCYSSVPVSGSRDQLDHYSYIADIDASCGDFLYDASSFFDDSISGAIGPYRLHDQGRPEMKPFSTAYIGGFYADTPDVPPEVYAAEAEKQTTAEVHERVMNLACADGFHQDTTDQPEKALGGKPQMEAKISMMPVWFLSSRCGDRISYACVNGQTGRVFADVPVDVRKFLIASLFLAVPIFLVLELFATYTPNGTVTLASMGLALASVLYAILTKREADRELHRKDKGYLYSHHAGMPKEKDKVSAKTLFSLAAKNQVVGFIILVILINLVGSSMSMGRLLMNVNKPGTAIVWSVLLLIAAIAAMAVSLKSAAGMKRPPVWSFADAALLALSCGILFLKPAQDLVYYLLAFLLLGAILGTELSMLGKYNMAATRRLPQFERRGGDDKA